MELKLLVVPVLFISLVVVAFFFIHYVLKTKRQLRRQDLVIRELRQSQNSDQLRLVESTLNPHLFKNILNSIQSHAYQTYFALDKLANVLDYILYDSKNQFVSPKEEIQFAENLIEINKIKLSPLFELQVKANIDENDTCLTQKVLAPLISIDLIENAFKHADLQSPDSYIKIVIELRNGIFSLTVANKISSKPVLQKEKGGIGSAAFEQRLQMIYGKHYTISRIKENDQYIAHLKINLREYQIEMHPS